MFFEIKNGNVAARAVSGQEIAQVLSKVENCLDGYRFDKYLYYPTKNKQAWKKFLLQRLERHFAEQDTMIFHTECDGIPFLMVFKDSKWDEELFGFKMATPLFNFIPEREGNDRTIRELLKHSLEALRELRFAFVSMRVHGDHLPVIHACEDFGFRYYETIIWPVAKCRPIKVEANDFMIRMMREDELQRIKDIAFNFQYQRGHYHCDPRFDREQVNTLYAKWVETSYRNSDPILVLECENTVAGYFVMKNLDAELSGVFGYSFGGLSSLALDARFRGRNFGAQLFHGGINALYEMGAEYTNGGYASKNHLSARMHQLNNMHSVYDELTFHLWL